MEELTSVGGAAPAVTRQYTYGLDLISQRQLIGSNWVTSWYQYDGHGSVRGLLGANGSLTDQYDYDAFGNLINQIGNTPNNYLYSGQQYDPDLTLYYNRARYLNVGTGRFWTQDSFSGINADPLTLHKYLYAGANPVNLIDPSGNFGLPELSLRTAIHLILAAISVLSTVLLDLRSDVQAPVVRRYGPPVYGPTQHEVDIEEQEFVLNIVFTAALLLLHIRSIGKQPRAGSVGYESLGGPEPYVIRYDPKYKGRPDPKWSIDTSGYTSGTRTANGGVRNNLQFWKDWNAVHPETLSPNNVSLIYDKGISPVIDNQWIQHFPEHRGYVGETLVHHHVEQGPFAIPVPDSTHPGSGGPFHGYPIK